MLEKEQSFTISKQDLADIITAAIAAAKAPNVVEQAKLDQAAKELEIAQASRLKTSESVKQEQEMKRQSQRVCSHEHRNGDSHCVYVQNGNYIICQKLQCIIRPGVAPKEYKGNDIYDTALFNRLFQKLPGVGDTFAD